MITYARIAACLAAIALLVGIGFGAGTRLKQAEWDADTLAREQADQAKAKAWAEEINLQRNQHDDQVRDINTRLADALERLRKRPERMPEPARATCKGATGAELSGPDGGFLEREAARADELRAALGECQAWADTVSKP